MNVIYYNNDKMSDTAEAKYKYDKSSPKLNRAPQGRRLRGLLGVRLPVDVPVAPCFSFRELYRILYFVSAVSDILSLL